MGSYVISVSLETGCYRHICISEKATLLMLHRAIQNAFDFDDDHQHAFFLDNHVWSHERAYFSVKSDPGDRVTKSCTLQKAGLKPGDKFKYLFDFGDEWVFQCRVLRRTEESVDIPYILKSVGESPEQYPDPEDFYDEDDPDLDADEDDWDSDYDEEDAEDAALLEEWKSLLPERYPAEKCQALYAALSVPAETIEKLHQYCTAVARIYGIAPVTLAYELYCKYEGPLKMEDYLACMEVMRHEDVCYSILGSESLYLDEALSKPEEREIIYDFLLLSGPEMYYDITDQRRITAPFMPEREELLRYKESRTLPDTPQALEMLRFLTQKLKDPDAAMKLAYLLTSLIAADFPLDDIWDVFSEVELKFNTKSISEFLSLYQELNNHTRKFVNYGFTPWELSGKGKRAQGRGSDGQMSLF